ncbi:hypothetical protein [Hydrocoleum sp. CS-953]|uniref:hypothetical protein n=1 Tax=Hydrocoleum sp. CS-953 TaxID=1671698 RepID=UPI000B9A289B|nr:hypothetical protein [Hydrocoleum sp. CS-953]
MINKLEQKQNLYLHIDGDIPEDLKKGTLISLQRSTPMKIYNLGFQPAKSIPEIPRWFLQKYASLPFKILEPFAGAGTTIADDLMLVFGLNQEIKARNKQYWGRELGMCWERIVKEICRQTCDNFNEAIRDGNDELCDFVVGLDAIDTKYRIGSGD